MLRRFLVLLVLGASAVAAQPLTLHSINAQPSGAFGNVVASAGDVTGDGVDDVLVGAWNEWWYDRQAGRAYVHDGATGALVHAFRSPEAEWAGAFGIALASVGDLDADGVPDLAIGAPDENGGGRVYLFSGATGEALGALAEPEGSIAYGYAIAPAGDVDGDGTPDILVGDYKRLSESGAVSVVSGATGQALHVLAPDAPIALAHFGRALAGGADVTGDGVADWIVAARGEEVEGVAGGRVYVISGATAETVRRLVSPQPTDGGQFGLSVALCPDVDGDGAAEIAVGAGRETGDQTAQGHAYLFSGAAGDLLQSYASPSPAANGWFGQSVACTGDLDGDDAGDLVVGAAGETDGATRSGTVYVMSTGTGEPLAQVSSPTELADGRFGVWVAALDGDTPRIAVGASREGELSDGAVHLVTVVRETVAGEARPADAADVGLPSPNPARTHVAVSVVLPAAAPVRVWLVDVQGRTVAEAPVGTLAAGTHRVAVGTAGLAAGTYLMRVHVGERTETRRFTLVR